jgi:hypothetical protein
MNNIQLMEIIHAYKKHSATVQDVENAVKEFAADVKQYSNGLLKEMASLLKDYNGTPRFCSDDWKEFDEMVIDVLNRYNNLK